MKITARKIEGFQPSILNNCVCYNKNELIETYKNERDTYKRLAEEYINKYNKEKEKNKRAINRISIVRMDSDTTTDTHKVLDYILKSLIGE